MSDEEKWVKAYEKLKKEGMLAPAVDYEELFAKSEFQGKKLFLFSMGTVTFPTGKIIVCDPLVYLDKNTVPYREKVPVGTFMLETLAARYPRIYAAGVSLGGNALAKYLGEEGAAAVPRAAAAVSAPVDLTAAGTRFDRGVTRLLYTRYFLRSLVPKAEAFPHFQTASPLKNCKTLGGFDDLFTAPLHGFTDRHDYYRRASCKPLLRSVRTPLLLLNAVSDPFLPPEALPTAAEVSDAVTLLQPPYGGHVGFVNKSGGRLNIEWMPETVLHYFETHGREAV